MKLYLYVGHLAVRGRHHRISIYITLYYFHPEMRILRHTAETGRVGFDKSTFIENFSPIVQVFIKYFTNSFLRQFIKGILLNCKLCKKR